MDERNDRPEWWCPTCEVWLYWDMVTYEETHDERYGGCGQHVLEQKPDTPHGKVRLKCGLEPLDARALKDLAELANEMSVKTIRSMDYYLRFFIDALHYHDQAEALIQEKAKLRAEVERLEGFLVMIGNQMLPDEMEDDQHEGADWECGYEEIVKHARKALAPGSGAKVQGGDDAPGE
jgi:hypothetical protein